MTCFPVLCVKGYVIPHSSSGERQEDGMEDLTERVMKAAEAPGYS